MLHKHARSLVLLVGLCAACGGDDDIEAADGGKADAGRADGSVANTGNIDSGTSGDVLESGLYTVSKITKLSDGCNLTLEDPDVEFTQVRLENIGGTTIALGDRYSDTTNPSFSPAGYALGSGPWLTARSTSLMASSRLKYVVNNSLSCEFNVQRSVALKYTARNTVDIDYTDIESNQTAGCAQLDKPTTTCTSHYTFTLSPPVDPLPDAGT